MLTVWYACLTAQVAIKQLERPHLVLRYVESELVNHSQLRHPHVVQFREVFLTEQHVSSNGLASTAQQSSVLVRDKLAWRQQAAVLLELQHSVIVCLSAGAAVLAAGACLTA